MNEQTEHTDDSAVELFAAAMKAKMAKQREKGYGDWDNPAACPADRLARCLRESVLKGDPVDVGNFAMMLFNRGERGTAEPPYNRHNTPNPPTALDFDRAASGLASMSSIIPTTPASEVDSDGMRKEADGCPNEQAVLQMCAAEDAELLGTGFLVDGQQIHPSRVTVVARASTAREGTRSLAPSFGQITITETPAAGGCYAAIQECVMQLPAGVFCVVHKDDLEALRDAAFFATPSEPTASGAEVVGHKTLSDGHGGFRHEPLTRAEADALIAHCESEDERRKALMPDERSAIRMMMDAHTRLTDMGWKDAIYCPKDGTVFEVIEPGSTGIFKCLYEGQWPKGSWWILEDSDMSPSRPVLFRPLAATLAGGRP